jgi:catechol-2,3-dioxygenase
MLIKRLELLTDDLVALRDYYAYVLDLPAHLEDDYLLVKAGKTDIIFTQAPSGWAGQYHFCFNIPENQLLQAKVWLSKRIPLLKDEKGNDEFKSQTWNAASLYFKDTAGNILEFIARHDQKNATEIPFNSEQILQVSEIGLPSKDVISFTKELCEKLGVSVYKQEPNETFTPIGNEDGLFILPIENRIWYPNTGVPARMLSVKVVVEVDGKEFKLSGVPYEVE